MISWAYALGGEQRNAYGILRKKTVPKLSMGRQGSICDDNIKIDLKEIRWKLHVIFRIVSYIATSILLLADLWLLILVYDLVTFLDQSTFVRV